MAKLGVETRKLLLRRQLCDRGRENEEPGNNEGGIVCGRREQRAADVIQVSYRCAADTLGPLASCACSWLGAETRLSTGLFLVLSMSFCSSYSCASYGNGLFTNGLFTKGKMRCNGRRMDGGR